MGQFPAFVLVSCLRAMDKAEEDQTKAAHLWDLSFRARILQVYLGYFEHLLKQIVLRGKGCFVKQSFCFLLYRDPPRAVVVKGPLVHSVHQHRKSFEFI